MSDDKIIVNAYVTSAPSTMFRKRPRWQARTETCFRGRWMDDARLGYRTSRAAAEADARAWLDKQAGYGHSDTVYQFDWQPYVPAEVIP